MLPCPKAQALKKMANGAGRVISPVRELSVREQIMVEEAVRQLKMVINLCSPIGLERRPVDSGGGKYEQPRIKPMVV